MILRRAGLLTTIQDEGRHGYQLSGIPSSGALDRYSFKIANMLVLNDGDEACLECTLLGPELQFEEETYFAITGGRFNAFLNESGMDGWVSYHAGAGDVLRVDNAVSGCRCYISFSGGIRTSVIAGSRSTYIRGGIGRDVESGDRIPLGNLLNGMTPRRLPHKYIPDYPSEIILKVVSGPQDDYFTQAGMENFSNEGYKITDNSDRMGCRLEGRKIEHSRDSGIISEGVPLGAIQVPGDGKPIILLADRQTTGGYPIIATVITPDIPKIAQAKPGDTIKFESIELDEAYSIYSSYLKTFEEIKRSLEPIKKIRRFRMKVDGIAYQIGVES